MSEIISVNVDSKLKRGFERLCGDVGLDAEAAITVFIKRSMLNNCIPFPIAGDPFYSDLNMNALSREIAEMDAGQYEEHELIEVDE